MDDELRLLQEKLHRVAERLSNFAPTKQNAEALRMEYRQAHLRNIHLHRQLNHH